MKSRIAAALVFLSACASPHPQAPASTPPAQELVPRQSSVHSPNALTPIAAAPRSIESPRIRVGILTDQSTVTFPRVDGGYLFVSDSGASSLMRGFTASAPLAGAVARFAVQVAAYSDKPSADALIARLQDQAGQHADAFFDPSASNGGLYRVLVGSFADAASAEPFRQQLVEKGFGQDLLVTRRPGDQAFEKRIAIRDDEGETAQFAGQSVLVLPATAQAITIGGKPYRSAARLFVNSRGLLNVINELNLEDYLRGVVPAEMGPKIYDELEALKAQAIAARTYAVRNLNGFSAEGFDVCPGPACQAYSGFAGEDSFSTRAVTETAGLVIAAGGRPIDALYTATCGGETSDVSTMFPGRSEPYLARVRCVELDTTTIAGTADSAMLTEQQLNARLFASMAGLPMQSSSWSASDVRAAVAGAARLIGWRGATDLPIPSARRGDVLSYLAAVFSLDANARVLTLPEDRAYFFPRSQGNDSAPYAAAAFLIKYGVWPAQEIDRVDMSAAMPREELYALLDSWLRKHEALGESTGKIAAVDGRRITLKNEGKLTAYDLPPGIPVYRRLGDRFQEYASAPVMIGDRAVIERGSSGKIAAAIIVANYDGASFDRTSSFANWTRSYRAPELIAAISKRAPIQQLSDIRALSVDASHRVIELEITAEGGRKVSLKGLPIRWALNVPDNLFVIEKTRDADGVDRYTFYGKGWGHGVGMCQVGAYGMAFRGHRYDDILKHYYTGVEIVPMSSLTAGR